MRHCVEVAADSLYVVASLAIPSFRRSLTIDSPAAATRLVGSALRGEAERHKVQVVAVENCLARQGREPKGQALKIPLRQA